MPSLLSSSSSTSLSKIENEDDVAWRDDLTVQKELGPTDGWVRCRRDYHGSRQAVVFLSPSKHDRTALASVTVS